MALDLALTNGNLPIIVLALAVAGLVVGFLSGLLGIGGGGILVPVLYETFTALGVDPAIRMHMALATTLAIIIPTSLRSFAAHRAKGSVDIALVKRLAPWVVLGVLLGVLTADAVSSTTLKWFWVVFGTVMGTKLAFGKEDWKLGDGIPQSWWVEVFGVFVGLASLLISIGGAVFIVALLTLYGRPVTQGVGTSSAFGPLIAIPGVIGHIWAGWGVDTGLPLSFGYVNLLTALLVIPTGLILAPVGVRVAHGIPRRRLEQAFAVFLMIIVLRFLSILLAGS